MTSLSIKSRNRPILVHVGSTTVIIHSERCCHYVRMLHRRSMCRRKGQWVYVASPLVRRTSSAEMLNSRFMAT